LRFPRTFGSLWIPESHPLFTIRGRGENGSQNGGGKNQQACIYAHHTLKLGTSSAPSQFSIQNHIFLPPEGWGQIRDSRMGRNSPVPGRYLRKTLNFKFSSLLNAFSVPNHILSDSDNILISLLIRRKDWNWNFRGSRTHFISFYLQWNRVSR